MGSGAEAAIETAEALNKEGRKVGVLNVHLYRPFSIKHFINALPETVKVLSVMDRTKETGSIGDPLYLDVCATLLEGAKTILRYLAADTVLAARNLLHHGKSHI